MCSVCPRFSWITTTPGTFPLAAAGFARYAMRFAPSLPLTSGVDTAIRGSFSFTVTPSVVGEAGGVANGCATSAGDAAAGAGDDVVAAGRGERSHAARIEVASAALPAMSVTRRISSRRGMSPSRKSSTCSSMKYRCVSFSSAIAAPPVLVLSIRERAGGGSNLLSSGASEP